MFAMMTKLKTVMLFALAAGAFPCRIPAVDWTQFRGPNHDGASPEMIATEWPQSGHCHQSSTNKSPGDYRAELSAWRGHSSGWQLSAPKIFRAPPMT